VYSRGNWQGHCFPGPLTHTHIHTHTHFFPKSVRSCYSYSSFLTQRERARARERERERESEREREKGKEGGREGARERGEAGGEREKEGGESRREVWKEWGEGTGRVHAPTSALSTQRCRRPLELRTGKQPHHILSKILKSQCLECFLHQTTI
jgi:hypothetical protein